MRAIYNQDISSKDTQVVFDKKLSFYHHLKNVIRIKVNQKILILNGRGGSATFKVQELSKHEIVLIRDSDFEVSRHKPQILNLFVGITKIDSYKQVLQNAVECGICNIIPLKSEYSQTLKLSDDKSQKIIISSIEQSNNLFKPSLHPVISISEIDQKIECLNRDNNALLALNYICYNNKISNLKAVESREDINSNSNQELIICKNIFVGPEGGWSDSDLIELIKLKEATVLTFNTPILRTYNAVVYAASQVSAKS